MATKARRIAANVAMRSAISRLSMKRIFIALALAFGLTGAMLIATIFGHAG
jgi:hypothetical protein